MHQFGLLAGVVASVEYLAALDESARGSRRERLSLSMQSAASYLNRIFDYLMLSLRSLPKETLPITRYLERGWPSLFCHSSRTRRPVTATWRPFFT